LTCLFTGIEWPTSEANKLKGLEMTRTELIENLSKVDIIGKGRIIIKELDYTNNPLAPEKKAWSVCYADATGNRRRAVYHGERFGFQWSK
jgi:hypothetical protein